MEAQDGWGSKRNGSLERACFLQRDFTEGEGLRVCEGKTERECELAPWPLCLREGQGDCPDKPSSQSGSHGFSGAGLGSLGFE